MKTPNYKDTESKHPIPHAKGLAKDEKDSAMNGSKDQKHKASKEEE